MSLVFINANIVADTAIHPLQDVLGLGAESRTNLPGMGEGHWT